MTRILIIDDDEAICTILKDVLEGEGYETMYCLAGEEGMRAYARYLPSVVLLDLRLPGIDGLAVLKDIHGFDPDAVVLMITGYGSVDSAVSAIRMGASDYLQKPLSNDEIILKIENALRNKARLNELSYLKEYIADRTPTIVGESKNMRSAVEALKKMAAYGKPILIAGEHGTGKNLAARLAHQAGKRRERPLVIFDCSALPPLEIEQELFGSADGRGGNSKMDEAEHGTLFLENIDFLPGRLQRRVLSLLQGAPLQLPADNPSWDGHVLASTSAHLDHLVELKGFDPGLYRMLKDYTITLPPLREREEDIPLLSEYFLDQTNKELRIAVGGFEPGAMRQLVGYSWPGNIRELRGVVRNAARNARSHLIKEGDIHFMERH